MLKNRALILLAASLFATTAVSAQNNPDSYYEEQTPRTFYGGLVFGANFTQVDGDNYAGYHKVGFNGGGIVYTRFDNHFAVSLEILYSQKGSHGNGDQYNVNHQLVSDYNLKLNYAEVPIQLCYFDRRKSHFGAGLSISRLASVQESGSVNNIPQTDFDKYPVKKMDYNFIVGGSLHLVKGLFLNTRFQYSLLPIRKGALGEQLPPAFAGRGEQYNNMWTVRLMYLF